MAAFLPSLSLLMAAANKGDSSDHFLPLLILFSLCLALAGGTWLWLLIPAKTSLPQPPVADQAPLPAEGTPVIDGVPAVRRVIRLHSTTPGQSPHEYNIGDNQGRRGSALVRAA